MRSAAGGLLEARRLIRVVIGVAALCAAAFLIVRFARPIFWSRVSTYVQNRSAAIVRERFQTDVQFGEFTITGLYPDVVISGSDVRLTQPGSAGLPPLIAVRKFSFQARLLQFLRKPAHVQKLELSGMHITVPPRGDRSREPDRKPSGQHYPVIVDKFVCTDCQLGILPKRQGKRPLQFYIHTLRMQDLGLGRSAPYQASLTNAVPKGEIHTTGRFGPWQPQDPSLTPLSGDYVFTHADLNPFPGIGGMLDSTGKFEGVLERIVADGRTSTPDFSLDVSGRPVPLQTEFHAIIDGTTGDTTLDPVRATLLHSVIVARGGVFGAPGRPGRMVLLDVTVNPGRLEDILRLGVKSDRPAMVGSLRFRTQMAILPGPGKVIERMKLNGRFFANDAHPTDPKLQEKLKQLSRRAKGKPQDRGAGTDVFDLKGRFVLDKAVADFPMLTFSIPGARLSMAGNYGLFSERLDFDGKLLLDAKLSQTIGGFKSIFLKPIDPFFRKNGKTVLPIHIFGVRSHPEFKLQLGGHRSRKTAPEYHAERLP